MPEAPSGGVPAAVIPRLTWWQRLRGRRVEVHDESMAPLLLPGDRLRVDGTAYQTRPPSAGDIIVLIDPERPDRWLIKRVAGVGPGQFWRTRSGLATRPSPDATEAITLPAGTVYVTGDAPAARDSSRFGPVPIEAVVGRASYRYYPTERRGAL
jgi:signal peptidase I